jgi:hypothetical protein
MDIQRAVTAPRYFNRYRYNSIPYTAGTVVDLEQNLRPSEIRELINRGHIISSPPRIKDTRVGYGIGWGAVNALYWEKNKMRGGAEGTRDGFVALA